MFPWNSNVKCDVLIREGRKAVKKYPMGSLFIQKRFPNLKKIDVKTYIWKPYISLVKQNQILHLNRKAIKSAHLNRWSWE